MIMRMLKTTHFMHYAFLQPFLMRQSNFNIKENEMKQDWKNYLSKNASKLKLEIN